MCVYAYMYIERDIWMYGWMNGWMDEMYEWNAMKLNEMLVLGTLL